MPCSPDPGAPEGALRGLCALYAELVQPARPLRTAFLAALLRPFDAASNLSAGAAAPDLGHERACRPVHAPASPMMPLSLSSTWNETIARLE